MVVEHKTILIPGKMKPGKFVTQAIQQGWGVAAVHIERPAAAGSFEWEILPIQPTEIPQDVVNKRIKEGWTILAGTVYKTKKENGK